MSEFAQHKCRFRMVASLPDLISPIALKRKQLERLCGYGFDARRTGLVPDRVDGHLFNTMEHGMDASIKGLSDRYYPIFPASPGLLDREREIVYACGERQYRFCHASCEPCLVVSIEDLPD